MYYTWATAWTLFHFPFAVAGQAVNEFSSDCISSHAWIIDDEQQSAAWYQEAYGYDGSYYAEDLEIGPCQCITADQYP